MVKKILKTNEKNIFFCFLSNNSEEIRICNQKNFSDNQIKEIDPNTFNGLANLERIDFSENQIKEIDLNTFNGSPNLRIKKHF